jgi:hypothetical protein
MSSQGDALGSRLGDAIRGALPDDETAQAWAHEADRLTRLAARALELASYPAESGPHKHTPNALVPWRMILETRRELERAGVDWRKYKRS